MSDPNKTPENTEPQEPYIPASPVKRIIAWVGVAYMVCLILLNLYPFFHGGSYLEGVFPLFICPAAVGLAVTGIYRFRQPGQAKPQKWLAVLLLLAGIWLCVMGLIDGIPPLIAGLRG